MNRIIYALCCPFTNEIHYIGKSTNGLISPFSHLSKSHSEKIKEWVSSLKLLGNKPSVKILERVSELDDLDLRERFYLQKYLNEDSLLLNSNLVTPYLVSEKRNKELEDTNDVGIEHISKFIKERRKMVGLTQEEFADKSGVALTVIRKLEQGKSNVNLDGMLQVLRMFGSTITPCKLQMLK